MRIFREFYFRNGIQVKPNDFSDLSEYFVQKELQRIIAEIKSPDGRTSPDVFDFTMDLVKHNDNSINPV